MNQNFEIIDEISVNRLDNPRIVLARYGQLAYGCDRGRRRVNEDRQVINTLKEGYVSIDGMGGYKEGALAAQILAEEFLQGIRQGLSAAEMQNATHQRIYEQELKQNGACYLYFTLRDRHLETYQAGDVRLIVMDRKGKVLFETEDERNSLIENLVTNCVDGIEAGETTSRTFELTSKARIIAASDGLWDNYDSSQEVADSVFRLSLEEAMAFLNEETKRRMPQHKRDNINVIMYDFRG